MDEPAQVAGKKNSDFGRTRAQVAHLLLAVERTRTGHTWSQDEALRQQRTPLLSWVLSKLSDLRSVAPPPVRTTLPLHPLGSLVLAVRPDHHYGYARLTATSSYGARSAWSASTAMAAQPPLTPGLSSVVLATPPLFVTVIGLGNRIQAVAWALS